MAGEVHGLYCAADVTDPGRGRRGARPRAAAAHGPARIAVACAGIAPAARSVDRDGRPHDPGLFARVIAVNLIGTFNLATQAAARMAAAAALNERRRARA